MELQITRRESASSRGTSLACRNVLRNRERMTRPLVASYIREFDRASYVEVAIFFVLIETVMGFVLRHR